MRIPLHTKTHRYSCKREKGLPSLKASITCIKKRFFSPGKEDNRSPGAAGSVLFRPGNALAGLLLSAMMTGCSNPPLGPAGFSEITALAGKRFAAYPSFDRKSKPDTVAFSFRFTGTGPEGLSVAATIDSGATWLPVSPLSVNGRMASLAWVPGNDTANFGYFGEQQCFLRIEGDNSVTAESDRFTIIGSRPLVLDHPSGERVFSLHDTITLQYRVNTDRISHIRIFFAHELMDWKEISGQSSVTESGNPPLKVFEFPFVPLAYDTLVSDHLDLSFRFLLKDYSSPFPNSALISDSFTLTP